MKCPECGREFEGNFCPECGHRADKERCPECGTEHGENERFCRQCGKAFAQKTTPAAPAEVRAEPFEDFTPSSAAKPTAEERKKRDEGAGSIPSLTTITTGRNGRPTVPALLMPLKYNNYFCIILGCCGFFAISLLGISRRIVTNTLIEISDAIWLIAAVLASTIVIVAAIILLQFSGRLIYNTYSRKSDSPAKPSGRTAMTVLYVTIILFILFYEIYFTVYPPALHIYAASTAAEYGWLRWLSIILAILIPSAIYAAYLLMLRRKKHEINKAYYGKEKPARGDRPIVTKRGLSAAASMYNRAMKEYWLAGRRRKCAANGAVLSGTEVTVITLLRGKVLSLVSFLATAAIVLAMIFSASANISNIFRTAAAERISLGMEAEQVRAFLGDPYDSATGADTRSETWTYYPEDYIKLIERNQSFDGSDIEDMEDIEGAFEEAMEFENAEYKIIVISFYENKVTSVLFDADRQGRRGPFRKAPPESYAVTAGTVTQGDTAATVTYTAHYGDGSYYAGSVGTYVPAELTSAQEGTQVQTSWQDPFGNRLEGSVTVIAPQI